MSDKDITTKREFFPDFICLDCKVRSARMVVSMEDFYHMFSNNCGEPLLDHDAVLDTLICQNCASTNIVKLEPNTRYEIEGE